MKTKDQRRFWNQASFKSFSYPFYIKKFSDWCLGANVLDYGCGYGRVMRILQDHKYTVTGVDYAMEMIRRGRMENKNGVFYHLDQKEWRKLKYYDAAILSTVLCCNPFDSQIRGVLSSIRSMLKDGGIVYVTDFLISEGFERKYQVGMKEFGTYGVYRTSEGGIVRHFSKDYLTSIFKEFGFYVVWYYEQPYFTMNKNRVNTFHAIICKPYCAKK